METEGILVLHALRFHRKACYDLHNFLHQKVLSIRYKIIPLGSKSVIF